MGSQAFAARQPIARLNDLIVALVSLLPPLMILGIDLLLVYCQFASPPQSEASSLGVLQVNSGMVVSKYLYSALASTFCLVVYFGIVRQSFAIAACYALSLMVTIATFFIVVDTIAGPVLLHLLHTW